MTQNNETTARASRDYGSYLTRLRLVVTLFLMIGIGTSETWGQAKSAPTPKVENGIYYITHTDGTWYLWPSVVTNTSTGQNYLTTFNGISAPAVNGKYDAHSSEYCHWIVKNVTVGDNIYIQIINAKTGEYIIRRKWPKSNNTKTNAYGDRDVWLDDLPADEDLAYSYFNLANDDSPYKISYPGNDSYSFNSAVGNDKAGLGSGNSGTDLADQRPSLIQLYSGGTPTWTFTPDKLDAPSINFNDSEGSYTITTTLSDVFKIRYTTDGSNPVTDPNHTAQTYVGPNPVVVEQNGTVKAVVVMFVDDNREHDIQLTEVASQEVHTATPPAPTFELTCDDKLQINCSVSTAKLYYTYTTDNTEPADPTNANTEWTEPVSLPDGAKVKAIAYNASIASEVSAVYTLIHNTASPTITLEATKATITFGSGITIHYTTNGTDPNPEDEGVTASPFEITGLNENTDVDIRVIATSEGRGNSCPVTVKKRPRKPALSVTSECGGTRTHQLTFSGVRSGHTYWYALSNGSNQPAPALNTFTEYTPGSPVEVSTIPAWNGTDIWVTLHSYSKDEEGNSSAVVSTNYLLKYTEAPTITSTTNANDITINISAVSGATIRYRVDDGAVVNATTSASFTVSKTEKHVIVATAQYGEEGESCEAIKTVIVGEKITTLSQLKEMTLDGAYVLAANIEMDESYTSKGTADTPFKGVFDGAGYTISGLKQPLFGTAQNAIIHDVNLKSVSISKAGDVGAIVCDAKGYTRIYNCGILPTTANFPEGTHSSVVATGNNGCAGSLVGKLEGDSRVVNCFSYADVTSTGMAAGIVGNNTYASNAEVNNNKYHKLKTMVVNCMFYGNASGSNVYPVYGGQKISNKGDNAINNYNFYSLDCTFTGTFADYCSWPAKKEYLKRYEYHRYLLNSNRELCGWWVGADNAPSTMTTAAVQAVPKDASMMAKWVLDPSVAPYPILKPFGYYSSPINIDADASWRTTAKEWEGKKLGSISVTIDPGDHAVGVSKTSPTDYVVTDMDTLRADYCYRKIQLPYYNKVFGNHNGANWNAKYAGNYTEWVVTGWEITLTNGADGTFLPNWQTGYNFADRNGSEKDKQRIFAQGGYYYVPNDVTSITIKAHWGRAIYLDNADHSYDRVTMSTTVNGEKGSPGKAFAPAGTRSALGNGQPVYTDKISKVATDHITSTNVYDNAIVLVGNHQYRTGDESLANKDCGFTIMSADLDFDSEPDYCLIWQLGNSTSRYDICPIRFDFLPVTEIGMAMKEDGSLNYYSLGCYRPLGHFEVTETSLIHFGQFEYGNKDRTIEAPLILNGGIYDQYCKGTMAYTSANDYINYIILGGNVYMPSFTPGAHVRETANYPTRHCAVNVIGGRINNLYLTGNFNDKVTPNTDSPHCYIDGGSFKQVAAAAKEGINGDVTFIINHSKIEEFYGGSTLADKLVTGNIEVTIDNSIVTKYCGGPKFGNMNLNDTDPSKNKTVKTKANNTVFTNYYGGGNGGTSYVQYKSTDETIVLNNPPSYDWAGKGDLNNYTPGKYRSGDGNKNYMADYEMEIVNSSAGTDSKKAVFRTYFYAAQFSATNTGPITNELKNCKVLKNFYGAGNLGGVKGNVNSTLENTEVEGSVFGAGYSASVPEVRIYDKTKREPTINLYTGIITPTPEGNGDYTAYTWTNKTSLGDQTLSTENPMVKNVGGKNYFFTEESLQDLGTVTGNVKLEIKGSTKVHGKVFDEHGNEVSESIDRGGVFGGGDASDVTGNTWVEMKNGTVEGSVFGGANLAKVTGDTRVDVSGGTIGKANAPKYEALVGNVFGGGKGSLDIVSAGLVTGNTSVTISGNAASPLIYHNIYGGGAYGSVGTFIYDGTTGLPTSCEDNTGLASVTITGGKIGTNGHENGMVFGSSRGDVAVPNITDNVDPNDRLAWVRKTEVTIGDAEKGVLASGNGKYYEYPLIRGSVYGSGENGHTFQDTEVKVHNGTIGIESGEEVTYNGINYAGFRYPLRGNVYGGGCGTDTYDTTDDQQKTKIYYNFNAGIVKGNTKVTIDGGHIVHNVYGGGAMGSVGTYTFDSDGTNDIQDGKPISCAPNTGKCVVIISGGSIGVADMKMDAGGGPDDAGHVFGAGRGEARNPQDYPNVEITAFYDMTDVTINNSALVMGSVYGGSESGHVLHNTKVAIAGGQIGLGAGMSEAYTEDQWASSAVLEPTNHWAYVDDGAPYDQYADENGNYANQVSARGGNRKATDGHTFYGNVFAGGSGYYPYAQGKWLFSGGSVGGNTELTITGGHILNNVYGGCEMSDIDGNAIIKMSGGTVGVPRTKQKILYNPTIGHIFGAGMGDKRTFFNTVTNVKNTSVNVTGGRIYGSVHGGGEDGHVLNLAETTISQANNEVPTIIGSVTDGGTSGFDGNVFGGGQGSPTALTAGTIGGNVKLTILGGTMYGSVYGGGRIASVGTLFRNPESDEYGKMQDGTDHGYITVNLIGGTIHQSVYGGCMGTRRMAAVDQVRFAVSKNVKVNLNGIVTGDYREDYSSFMEPRDGAYVVKDNVMGCIVKGNIFGCNNVNSSPQEDVTVHIYATQSVDANRITNPTEGEQTAKVKERYDVNAVYGGGNMAAYLPKGPNATADNYDGKNTSFSTHVIIDGCGRTSIRQVYGGGNAAPTPATEVTVNGTYEIDELFGGGNGADQISYDEGTTMLDNPGANVGFYDYSAEEDIYNTKEKRTEGVSGTTFESKYVYGTGKAAVNIFGGTINYVFGGSNTKGNVRETAITLLEEKTETNGDPCCPFNVGEVYGGGKSAPMDADAKMYMACIPGLRAAYGGAEEADIQGGVTLNITNGTFERVFGGNNLSGTIRGPIEVNIEETGCRPIIIGELYGGGNQAPYSVYGYHDDGTIIESGTTKAYKDPVVNVKSFTSIGEIYGGGYGSTATMVGDPTVNVNVTADPTSEAQTKTYKDSKEQTKFYSDYAGETKTIGDHSVILPPHVKGKMGVINNVFGGGNAAPVKGNTQVNIGTTEEVYMLVNQELTIDTTDVSGFYIRRGGSGTTADPYEYTPATGTAVDGTTYYKRYSVLGADIRGNVYGGGNNAEVTGNAEVVIGKKKTD